MALPLTGVLDVLFLLAGALPLESAFDFWLRRGEVLVAARVVALVAANVLDASETAREDIAPKEIRGAGSPAHFFAVSFVRAMTEKRKGKNVRYC